MKYKVGDIVRVKNLEDIKKNPGFKERILKQYCGNEYVISELFISTDLYMFRFVNEPYDYWIDDFMVEKVEEFEPGELIEIVTGKHI